MSNLAISSRIREIKGDRHVSEVQRDIDAMDDADKMRVFTQETLDFNGFDFDFRGLMSPLSAPISNVFETPPGRSFFSPESLSQAVSRIAMGLHGRLVEVFNSLGDGASEAIQTMVVGLTVAMKHIGQVAELIPHLMKENGIELNKENYMKHFAASFEFIDDLTQLNTNDINSIEYYLLGVPSSPVYDAIVDDLLSKLKPLVQPGVVDQILNLAQDSFNTIHDQLKAAREQLGIYANYVPSFFKFADSGSVTLKDEAVDNYARRFISALNKLESFIDGVYEKYFKVKNLRKNFTGCPAKSVVLDVHGEQVNMVKALYDYFLRYLDQVPNLDSLVKSAA